MMNKEGFEGCINSDKGRELIRKVQEAAKEESEKLSKSVKVTRKMLYSSYDI